MSLALEEGENRGREHKPSIDTYETGQRFPALSPYFLIAAPSPSAQERPQRTERQRPEGRSKLAKRKGRRGKRALREGGHRWNRWQGWQMQGQTREWKWSHGKESEDTHGSEMLAKVCFSTAPTECFTGAIVAALPCACAASHCASTQAVTWP